MSDKTATRVVGVIPARWGSTRLPGKSLVPLCGKPLVQWVAERAAAAAALDAVLVATDDERIRDAVCGFGGTAVMTRPDHASGTDRVAEAVAALDAEIVINIQGDMPLIDPDLIDRLAQAMRNTDNWDMATAAVPLRDENLLRASSVVKVVCAQDGRALYFSRAAIPFVRDPGSVSCDGLYAWHLGIYAYRRAFLERLVNTAPCALERAESLEQLRALFLGGRILVLPADGPVAHVDVPEDVATAEAAIRAAGLA